MRACCPRARTCFAFGLVVGELLTARPAFGPAHPGARPTSLAALLRNTDAEELPWDPRMTQASDAEVRQQRVEVARPAAECISAGR